MRQNQFTRPAIVTALELLDVRLSQAKFDQMVLRLGLENSILPDSKVSVAKKAAAMGRTVLASGNTTLVQTVDGTVTLTEAMVREAVAVCHNGTSPGLEQERFVRALGLDGFVIEFADNYSSQARIRAALPGEVDLPATDDEVHELLKHFNFLTTLGHLDQAIEAHTRGDWAAANSQTRTFIESLFDQIAHHIDPTQAAALGGSEARRQLLGNRGFLSIDRNEWSPDGKNFVNGLFKMLHTEGSHPGLSHEDRSTFRLHLALVTGRTFLRRLKNGT